MSTKTTSTGSVRSAPIAPPQHSHTGASNGNPHIRLFQLLGMKSLVNPRFLPRTLQHRMEHSKEVSRREGIPRPRRLDMDSLLGKVTNLLGKSYLLKIDIARTPKKQKQYLIQNMEVEVQISDGTKVLLQLYEDMQTVLAASSEQVRGDDPSSAGNVLRFDVPGNFRADSGIAACVVSFRVLCGTHVLLMRDYDIESLFDASFGVPKTMNVSGYTMHPAYSATGAGTRTTRGDDDNGPDGMDVDDGDDDDGEGDDGDVAMNGNDDDDDGDDDRNKKDERFIPGSGRRIQTGMWDIRLSLARAPYETPDGDVSRPRNVSAATRCVARVDNNVSSMQKRMGVKPKTVLYQLHYHCIAGVGPLSENRYDYWCPWCLLNAATWDGLLTHLRVSHSVFLYTPEICKNSVPHLHISARARTSVHNTSMPRHLTRGSAGAAFRPGSSIPEYRYMFQHFGTRYGARILYGRRSLTARNHHHNYHHVPMITTTVVVPAIGNGAVTTTAGHHGVAGIAVDDDNGMPAAVGMQARVGSDNNNTTTTTTTTTATPMTTTTTTTTTARSAALPRCFHSIVTDPCTETDYNYDSEDDPDETWIEIMDRARLQEFEDVSGIEKEFMTLWNDFARPTNAVADSQVPLLCEAFARTHAQQLVDTKLEPHFICHLTNLWDNGIIDSACVVHCAEVLWAMTASGKKK